MSVQSVTALQEHSFWLEVLEDHAYFIRDFISASEKQFFNMAKQYIALFSNLRGRLRLLPENAPAASVEMITIAREIYPVAYGYYQFEGHLQQLRLENKVNLNLTPTYLNGTLGENQEYLRMLGYYVNGQEPPILPLVDLMDLWLEDQAGHAALLVRTLDGVESHLVNETRGFMQTFQAFIVKNEAIKGYLRFAEEGFPIQLRFAKDVALAVLGLTQNVEKIVYLYKNDEVLNQGTLRFLEHHFPEACYFLIKLSHYAPDIDYPPCTLTKPSFR
ncbi:hypothetical protein WQ57_08375 [Mesobacillus campisalis]|uniref:DUF2935 domain-containing protein n=1 Tax=Mesobacillus campisalis TaxID=1408103 RepID=A0A0M2SWQ1_9BACI|nr:DUF2935 domain-containing protein [Mesobacillus campisalis]KKK38598.1 hypothetical protein WQ57_08375 [Mesobacillus campisalis]